MPTPPWKRSETYGLGIALLTLILTSWLGYQDWRSFESARLQAGQMRGTTTLLRQIFSEIQDLETGQRGYLLVGEPSYLAPYEAAKRTVRDRLAQLHADTAGDPEWNDRVQRIDGLLQKKMDELQRSVDARQTEGYDAAVAIVRTNEGKLLMDGIRGEVTAFLNTSDQRLQALQQSEERSRRRAVTVTTVGTCLLFLLLSIAAVLVRTRSDARERALISVANSKREVERVRDLLETTLRSIGDAVITTDSEGRVTFLNVVAQDLTGWGVDCYGKPLDDVFKIINEYSREKVESPVDKVRRTGMVAGLANHTLLLRRDGREIPIDDSGAPIRDDHGGIIGFVLVFRDISEHKVTENALRVSEERFRTLANAAPVLLWVTNPEGSVTFVNRGWTEFTGRSAQESQSDGWVKDIWPEDVDRVREIRRAAMEQDRPYTFECRLRRKDGEYRDVICSSTPRFTESGKAAEYVGAWFDITELKEAQRSLEISERRFRTLVAGTTSMVWQTDASGLVNEPQPEWESFTGQTFDHYRGTGGDVAIHPDDRVPVSAAFQNALRGREGFTVEFRLWHQLSRQYRPVVSRGVPLTDANGQVLQWIGTITDVTEQRRLEEKLRQAAKLESLGVLAGGIAHDFNNLLVGILGNASLLHSLTADPEQSELAAQILAAGERAAVLTQQMLAYSGRGHFVVQPTDLSAETDQIVPLVRSSIPKHVELVLRLARDLPTADVDRAQLQQLIMNLVINGAEAIDTAAGTVTVSTYAQTLSRAEIAERFAADHVQPGPYVVLDVQDTGHGMDVETQAKIFDPFFTTKFTGRGLGLAAVMGIVRGHKGSVQVISKPGAGTTFRVFLPAAGGALPAHAQVAPPVLETGVPSTVLVVDDEEIVRRVAQGILTRRGFAVLLAANGQEAIRMLETHRDEVSAILLDLTMPVMSGEEALPRLREIRSDVRIVASSGYSQAEAERRFGASIDGFVQKPYTAENLLSALRVRVGASK